MITNTLEGLYDLVDGTLRGMSNYKVPVSIESLVNTINKEVGLSDIYEATVSELDWYGCIEILDTRTNKKVMTIRMLKAFDKQYFILKAETEDRIFFDNIDDKYNDEVRQSVLNSDTYIKATDYEAHDIIMENHINILQTLRRMTNPERLICASERAIYNLFRNVAYTVEVLRDGIDISVYEFVDGQQEEIYSVFFEELSSNEYRVHDIWCRYPRYQSEYGYTR